MRLTLAREFIHVHPDNWTADQELQAAGYLALAKLEQAEKKAKDPQP